MNQAIRANEIRVIGADGEQLGVMSVFAGRELADAAGMDLIEIASEAKPPVCKIIEYSKFKYEQDQRERDRRKNHIEVKEMKFGVRIGSGDVDVKCRKIIEFLTDGDRVKVVVQMKGRENTHPELADALMQRIISNVEAVGKVEGKVSRDGNRFNAQLIPKTTQR
jgi:translation initiation factor IF-3